MQEREILAYTVEDMVCYRTISIPLCTPCIAFENHPVGSC